VPLPRSIPRLCVSSAHLECVALSLWEIPGDGGYD
jgi:hypothetical protein